MFLLSLILQVITPEISWQIRSGFTPDGNASLAIDDPVDLVSTGSSLVNAGRVRSAELFWRNPSDPPVTRLELLSALAWNGRYHLLRVIPDISAPTDISGSLLGEKCAAVCTLGWMTVREDGLFHGEELVTRGDILTLSRFVPELDTSASCIFLSDLEKLVP